MKKTTLQQCLLFMLYFSTAAIFGKVTAQIVIGTPDLQFTQACANDTFNTFTAEFVFSPETGITTSNQFIVELSDGEGYFSNPDIVFTSNPGEINSSPAAVEFSLPSTTAGEGYRIRIKSTHPEATSTPSESFTAYYKVQDSPFTINELIPTGSYCPGGSYLLTIDNPGLGNNDSPLNYPSLTFNWFKEIDETTFVFVAEGPTLSVSQEGVYFVETNYGTCTSDSFSNRVAITEATAQDEVYATITSSSGNPFCASDGPTTLSTIEGNGYQWYRNGNLISGATNQNYETDVSGTYDVIVSFGSCQAAGTIELQTGSFTSSLDVPTMNMLEEGDSLIVSVTTTATDPEFQWFLDSEPIPNATQSTLTVTEFGAYNLIITQTTNCITSSDLVFFVDEFINPFPEVTDIPNIVSPNGDGVNDTWIIPTQYVSGSETEVVIISSQGETILNTKDYLNDWPQDQKEIGSVNEIYYYMIIPQNEAPKKGSITLIK